MTPSLVENVKTGCHLLTPLLEKGAVMEELKTARFSRLRDVPVERYRQRNRGKRGDQER